MKTYRAEVSVLSTAIVLVEARNKKDARDKLKERQYWSNECTYDSPLPYKAVQHIEEEQPIQEERER